MIYEPIGLTFTVQGHEKKMYAGIVEEAKIRVGVVLDQSNVTQLHRS